MKVKPGVEPLFYTHIDLLTHFQITPFMKGKHAKITLQPIPISCVDFVLLISKLIQYFVSIKRTISVDLWRLLFLRCQNARRIQTLNFKGVANDEMAMAIFQNPNLATTVRIRLANDVGKAHRKSLPFN